MSITKIQTGGIPDLAVTHDKLHTDMDLSTKTVTLPSAITDTITNKLPLAGGTLTGTLNLDVADLFVKDTTGGALGQVQIGAGTVQGFINIQKGDGTRNVQLSSDGDSFLNGGNVGINNTSPLQKLSINGRVNSDLNQDYYGAWFEGNTGTNGDNFFAVGDWYSSSTYFEKRNGESYAHIYNYNGGHNLVLQAGSGANGRASTTAGNVGIGTTSPTARLDVRRGDAAGKIAEFHQNTGYGIDIGSSQSVAYISSGYNQRLDFKTDPTSGQTERMSILANGNVGIGTITPAHDLVVQNDDGPIISLIGHNYNDQMGIVFNGGDQTNASSNGNTGAKIMSQLSINGGQVLGDLTFTTNSGDTFVDAMNIDETGDIGIGVSQYNDCKVTIGGTVPSYSSVLMFDNNTTGGAEFFMLASDSTWSAGAGNFYMGHGAPGSGNIDMSIDGGGWIVAKTKAFIATSSTQRETFYNSGDGAGLYKQNAYSSCGTHMEISNNAAHGWSNIYLHKSWSSGQDQRMMQFTVNTSNVVGSITVNASSTSYATSSDYRLKENVVGLTGASARVNQLKPSRFNFIVDDTNTLVDGFLAHEVATVVPEAITGTHDGMKDEEYEVTPAVLDDDGNVTTEAIMGTRSVPDYQGIDQSKLIPLLTAALQEALTEIASLKTRVEALE